MKHFITLEEFLTLQDPHCSYSCSAHNLMMSPENWVAYYNCAKENWELFGDQGPPVHTTVVTLRSGHNGRENCHRTINSIEGNYFTLITGAGSCSLVPKEFWWLHFSIVGISPFTNQKPDWS